MNLSDEALAAQRDISKIQATKAVVATEAYKTIFARTAAVIEKHGADGMFLLSRSNDVFRKMFETMKEIPEHLQSEFLNILIDQCTLCRDCRDAIVELMKDWP